MEIDLNSFKTNGYIVLDNILSPNQVDEVRVASLNLKNDIIDNNLLDTHKFSGFKTYWRGLDMSSTMSKELFKHYTSDFMFNIATTLLETNDIYLFNDQVVVKLPNEDFEFLTHTDNEYGPNNEMAKRGDFKTITCCWVLDDFNSFNGPISILNQFTNNWDTPLPKKSSVMVWNGNTPHMSSKNESNSVRCVWLCVYSTINLKEIKNITNTDYNNFYGVKFNKTKSIL